jgi:hypothetical protein
MKTPYPFLGARFLNVIRTAAVEETAALHGRDASG